MQDIKNNFSGGLNLDDSYNLFPKVCYADARNITRNALEGNNDKVLTNIIGNRLVPYDFKPGINKAIGCFPFQLRGTTINFIYNSNGFHSVTEFNAASRSITKIFESRTDSDDIDILNFSINGKITGVNVYPREGEGDLLFFLDSLGRPTEMDIAIFKSGEYTPVTRDVIDTGKNPPLSPPSLVYDNDTSTRSNYYYKKLVRGKYRWIYDDLTKSTFSPISSVPLPVSILSDVYTNVITNNNVTRWIMNTGDKNVKSIEVAFSFVDASNNWSDFQSITVLDKSKLAFSASVQIIAPVLSFPYRAIITFSGIVLGGTVINIYATQLPSTLVLIGTYTTALGDTIASIGAALVSSLNSIGIATSSSFSGSQLVINLNSAVYTFDAITIVPSSNPVVDNINISFAFYNESTYPNVDIAQSIQLYDLIPDYALAQDLANGDTLVFGAITEGYDKDTTEDAIITIDTIPAGNGGSVGNLSAIASTFGIAFGLARGGVVFSGVPATGTIVNLKLRRSSDHTTITGGSYTTIAGDTPNSIAANIDFSVSHATVVIRSGVSITFTVDAGTYEAFPASSEYLQVEIIPPTTATATNSIATWPFSSSRNIGRVYFDKKGKTNGVLYTDKVTFPAYAENGSNATLLPFINYKINDVPPNWAFSVQFVFTKDATYYKVWQSLAVQIETAYIYFEVTSFTTNATKKPTTAQVCSYSFQDGDRLRIWRNTDNPGVVYSDAYDSAIEGLINTPTINGVVTPTGSLFLKIKNVAPFTGVIDVTKNYIICIYRPTQQTSNPENKVYYELGRQYSILDPTLATRRHAGEVTDQVVGVTPAEYNFYEGDVYFRERTIASTDTGYATFNIIDQNFVDFYISAVNSIDGRPNVIDINAKRQFFGATIRFSQNYQVNTNINGLNRFYENNLMDVDYSFGNIIRFRVRDRFLKCFQQLKIGVIPLYGELTKDGSGNVSLIVTDKLLNPIQYRIGNFGLTTPETLASWHFADYGGDLPKGIIWRDSNDGVEPISELYKVDSWATIELPLRGGDSHIYGAIDPKKDQYIMALEAYTVPVPFFSIDGVGLNSITGTSFTIVSAGDYTVDWGDGTVDSFLAGTTHPTHVYLLPYTGEIIFYPTNLSDFTTFTFNNAGISPVSNSIAVKTSEVSKLTELSVLVTSDAVFLNGIVTDLPDTLTNLSSSNTNLSGNVLNLSRVLTKISVSGTNAISGFTSDLPPNLQYLLLYGNNTLTGDVVNIPRTVTVLFVNGNNTIFGNISGLPPILIQMQVLGLNLLLGNVSGFPSTLNHIVIYGNNTISGNISGLPSILTFITIIGVNTISGLLSGMPPLVTFFQITGSNSISGDLASIPNGVTFFNVNSSLCSIDTYTSSVRAWSSTMNAVLLVPGSGGLSTTEVDNVLIELAAQTTLWVGNKMVSLLGGSSPRSAASDAAVATLEGLGVTINTT